MVIMRYKNYDLPGDLLLIIKVFWLTLRYRRLIKQKPLPDILAEITQATAKTDKSQSLKQPEYMILDKVSRAADFLLLRILNTQKPCLPRSLVLFHWCSYNGLSARLIVGVKKEEKLLQGHSWLLLEGRPYREDLLHLHEYTIMLEGSNE